MNGLRTSPKNVVQPWPWCVLVNRTPLQTMPLCGWTVPVKVRGHVRLGPFEKYGFCKKWPHESTQLSKCPWYTVQGFCTNPGCYMMSSLAILHTLERLCWASPKDNLVPSWTPCESLLCCKSERGFCYSDLWSVVPLDRAWYSCTNDAKVDSGFCSSKRAGESNSFTFPAFQKRKTTEISRHTWLIFVAHQFLSCIFSWLSILRT